MFIPPFTNAEMSVPNLYRIENEDTKSVPRDTLRRLSKALEIDLDAEVRVMLGRAAQIDESGIGE